MGLQHFNRLHLYLLPLTLCLFFAFCGSSPSPEPENAQITNAKLELVTKWLEGPVCMEVPKDGSNRIFICEQLGLIKVLKNGSVLPRPFLNVQNKLSGISKGYSEKGLLGMCFHPDFKKNGRFFVFYSTASNNKKFNHISRVSEFYAKPGSHVADSLSEKIILEVYEPESNHNGGQLAFGPDGYLYIGLGDGGGAGDPHGPVGNGQDLNTHLGKILRIDVNGKAPYTVPKDNPFVNKPNVKPEIWAYGLRNPWRFSFDMKTGKLFCGDVGQNKLEEVDIIEKGKNYGWRIMEGTQCYEPEENCKTDGLTMPIAEYGRKKGICIIGGYVYRGKALPALEGKYIFADWQGRLYYLEEKSGKWTMHDLFVNGKKENQHDFGINSLGQDEKGEIYFLTQGTTGPDEKGVLYKLVAQ